jgi:hypothetical protein
LQPKFFVPQVGIEIWSKPFCFFVFFLIIALQPGCGTITTEKFSHLGSDQNFVNTFYFGLLK